LLLKEKLDEQRRIGHRNGNHKVTQNYSNPNDKEKKSNLITREDQYKMENHKRITYKQGEDQNHKPT